MVNGHELAIDTISPAARAATKGSSRRKGRSRKILGASFLMKSKPTLETDDLSECEEECDVPIDIPSIDIAILQKICQQFEAGVNLIEKKHPLRRRPDYIFSGSDAVSYLVDRGYAASRSVGLTIGRRLAYEFALFEHISMDFDLMDKSDEFYRFIPVDKREVVTLCEEAASNAKGQDHLYNIDYIADVFEEGVEVGPNVFHYRTYNDTFVGRDAVSFLVNHRLARSRQDAVRVGNLLLERGIFRHCSGNHQFKDKFLFYRFIPHKKRIQEKRPGAVDAMPVEALAMRFRELVKPSLDPHHPFRNTFCGSAAVDAIINGSLASSRFEAVQIGQKLAEDLQLFYCVYDSNRPFLDNAHTYYQYYNHDLVASLNWLQNADTTVENDTRQMKDDEISHSDSLEYEDLFGDDAQSQNLPYHDDAGDDVTEKTNMHFCINDDSNAGGAPDIKISAFNKSMRMVEDEDDDGFNLSGIASSVDTDKNSSIVDALLFEDSARYFDKYGFVVGSGAAEKEMQTSTSDLHKKYIGCNLSEDEWGELLDECSSAPPGTVSKASLTKMKHAIRLGLSDCHRQRAWTLITGVDILMPEKVGEYCRLVSEGFKANSSSNSGVVDNTRLQALRGVIERDLHRTFPGHILFSNSSHHKNPCSISGANCSDNPSRQNCSQLVNSISASREVLSSQDLSGSCGSDALRRILYAYSVYDPDVGYCQGMNFVAGMFLTFLPEEESFWMFVGKNVKFRMVICCTN